MMGRVRDVVGRAWPAAIAIAGIGNVIWIAGGSSAAGRQRLIGVQFWSLEILVVFVVALTLHQLPGLFRSLHVSRRDWQAIGVCVLLGGILAGWVAPRTNRIFYDEQIYQGIGQNLSDLRRAQMCHEGITQYGRLQCFRGEYNKQPNAYPHLLSIAYRAVGVSDSVAHGVNIALMMAHVLVIALVAGIWVRDRWTIIAAAAVFATIPQQLQWSATAAAEPSAAFAGTFAVLAALHFSRTRETASLMWAVVTATWAAQFRPESILILPIVALVIATQATAEIGTPRMLRAAALGMALLSVHIAHLVVVSNEGWGASGDRFSTAFLSTNLEVNGWFYLADWRFPALYGVAAIGGLFVPGHARFRLVTAAYFAAFWSVFLFFYAGSYNYGADVRYSLMTYPPLALLAGRAIGFGLRQLSDEPPIARLGVVGAIAYVLMYLPAVRATGEEAWAARADVEHARAFAAAVPPNALILTHNPHMFHLWGRNAAQLSIAVHEPGFMQSVRDRHGQEIYLHWNFWCSVADPVQRDLCPQLLAVESGRPVMDHRERGYRFALIKLEGAK